MKKLLLENLLLKISALFVMMALFSTPTHSNGYCAAAGGNCPGTTLPVQVETAADEQGPASSPFLLLLSI